jgi:4-hydroxy-tetrahydrodipicolinate reductase
MIDLIVCGVGGRMGGAVVRAAQGFPEVRVAGAVDRPGGPRVGKDAGEVASAGTIGVKVSEALEPLLERGRAVIVDFTRPEASLGFLRTAAEKGAPIVIGTTGFAPAELREIERLASRAPTLLAANMSLGVNLLLALVGKVARALGDGYDVEIVEAHHRFKKDAPSGTALALAREVAAALGRDVERVGVTGRRGSAAGRGEKEIGLFAVRAGDIVGEHTVIFGGLGERVELVHRAHSRETFARGAIRAAAWLAGRPAGLYDMREVLGLGA